MASASYLAFYDLCTLHFVGIVQHVCQGHQQRCTPHAAPAMNMQMNITRMSDVSQLRYKFILFQHRWGAHDLVSECADTPHPFF